MRRILNAVMLVFLYCSMSVTTAQTVPGASSLRLMSPAGHAGAVDVMAIRSDATMVATGAADQRIHLWHLPTSRQWRSLAGHRAGIRSLAFSPDGTLLLSGDESGTVRIWRVADGAAMCKWDNADDRDSPVPRKQAAVKVGWVDNTTLWAVGQGGLARQWRLKGCAQVARIALHDSTTWDALRDATGWTVATQDAVLRLDLSGKQQWRLGLDIYPLSLHKKDALGALLLSDGRLLEFDQQGRLNNTAPVQLDARSTVVTPVADGWLASNGSLVVTRVRNARLQEFRPQDALEDPLHKIHHISLDRLVAVGSTVVAAGADGLLVMDERTLAVRQRIDVAGAAYPTVLAVSAASKRMLVAGISDAVLWDTTAGRPIGTLLLPVPKPTVTVARFSKDGRKLWLIARHFDAAARVHKELLFQYQLETNSFLPGVTLSDSVFEIAEDELRQRVMLATGTGLQTFSSVDLSAKGRLGSLKYAEHVDVDPTGTHLISASANDAELIDLTADKVVHHWPPTDSTYKAIGGAIQDARVGPSGKAVWFASANAVTAISSDGVQQWRSALAVDFRRRLALAPGAKSILVSGAVAAQLDASTGRVRAVEMASEAVSSAWMDSRSALMLGADGVVRLWQAGARTQLELRTSAGAAMPCRGEAGLCDEVPPWIVSSADGRFDLADFAAFPQLVWYRAGDPYHPLQLEWFASEAFTPRMLGHTLAGITYPAIEMTGRRLVPPQVRVTAMAPVPEDPKLLRIDVEVDLGSAPLGGVLLYRDGMRVARLGAAALARRGRVLTARFETVRMREDTSYIPMRFEAVAVDTDGIRGSAVLREYKLTAPANTTWTAPRTWVLNIGVNRHENPLFNLTYAANDAHRLGHALKQALGSGNLAQVTQVPLVSDVDPLAASKARIREALEILSGTSPRSKDPLLHTLDRAGPSDTVFISFAGHGFVGPDGEFYLVPGDTGAGNTREVSPALLSRSIASRELAQWLEGMDARRVILVLDACHAAAAVNAEGFVPGPMDSAGLGQLAYDKGFAVLVATQADDVALQSGRLQHGLLSYALAVDGLGSALADFSPRDGQVGYVEWLRYGTVRVPELVGLMKRGALPAAAGSRNLSVGLINTPPNAQTPSLFYFPRGRLDEHLLTVSK